ncbi:MAG: hypothetical protein NTX11_03560 [Candidatus Saccharibacteria bacterium]|nr:hypothetical protein [Candidatus Saccharibacteria bacterium]
MLSYSPIQTAEFTAHEDQRGIIYHQRGAYELIGESGIFLPVNRSYRPQALGVDTAARSASDYIADKLIHDTVCEEDALIGDEVRLEVLGKTLLFYAHTSSDDLLAHSSSFEENTRLSEVAKKTIEGLANKLDSINTDLQLGLHGSHQVGLSGADSDMDLVAWSGREQRAEVLESIRWAMKENGFVDANTTNRFEEYAVRISRLMGVQLHVGAYLASQRLRWVSPEGASTSLQLVHSDYDHVPAAFIIDNSFSGKYSCRERVDTQVELLDDSEPFNYPRIWHANLDGEKSTVISFNMVHQGMGTNGVQADDNGGLWRVVGQEFVDNKNDERVILLRDDGDFILPKSLAQSTSQKC